MASRLALACTVTPTASRCWVVSLRVRVKTDPDADFVAPAVPAILSAPATLPAAAIATVVPSSGHAPSP